MKNAAGSNDTGGFFDAPDLTASKNQDSTLSGLTTLTGFGNP
jgi:hypothetical protein